MNHGNRRARRAFNARFPPIPSQHLRTTVPLMLVLRTNSAADDDALKSSPARWIGGRRFVASQTRASHWTPPGAGRKARVVRLAPGAENASTRYRPVIGAYRTRDDPRSTRNKETGLTDRLDWQTTLPQRDRSCPCRLSQAVYNLAWNQRIAPSARHRCFSPRRRSTQLEGAPAFDSSNVSASVNRLESTQCWLGILRGQTGESPRGLLLGGWWQRWLPCSNSADHQRGRPRHKTP